MKSMKQMRALLSLLDSKVRSAEKGIAELDRQIKELQEQKEERSNLLIKMGKRLGHAASKEGNTSFPYIGLYNNPVYNPVAYCTKHRCYLEIHDLRHKQCMMKRDGECVYIHWPHENAITPLISTSFDLQSFMNDRKGK